MRWEPIKTAPKDGTKILFRLDDGNVESGAWAEFEDDGIDSMGCDAGWLSDSGMTFPGRSFGNPDYFRKPIEPPVHWMPMPPEPEYEDDDEDEVFDPCDPESRLYENEIQDW